ncbi:unnamed protein product [Rotaria sp. Silwood1]|nr:unnamed protein product [Rotaria sp. Silwood1]CAF4532831.1 unnamed protein product [Rotaria sp. Silwood1]CAF4754182.1 unnamed protein product [Rotaria sp. Silwood1]
MHTLIVIIITIIVSFLQFNKILCQSEYGSFFPIPLTIPYEDPNFQRCPSETGAYVHTTNCSLFHHCTFGIHRIYSCIDEFFFNPISNRCQRLSMEKEVKCEVILQKMMDLDFYPLIEIVKDYEYHHHRKSATSKCIQTGIYPDILDCSLFHYCHENKYHEIFKCSNGLHFDPKTYMCLPSQLVNCQYELSTKIEDDIITICHNYAPGTYLPVPNRFDEFIICKTDDRSISMKCKSGLIYNALTTACEKGPCTFDSTLCKNEGQCIDEPTNEKGFKCICSNQFQGDFCEKDINLIETTEQVNYRDIMAKNSNSFLQQNNFDETTHIPYTEKVITFRKNKSIITTKASIHLSQNKPLIYSEQKRQVEQMIKILFIIIVTLIGLVLFGSIIFGIVIISRLIIYSSRQTTGEWKTLQEESNI